MIDSAANILDWLRRIFYCSRHGHQLKDLPMEVYCLRCGWHRGREDWL